MSIAVDALSDIILTIADMLFARKTDKRSNGKRENGKREDGKEGCHGVGK